MVAAIWANFEGEKSKAKGGWSIPMGFTTKESGLTIKCMDSDRCTTPTEILFLVDSGKRENFMEEELSSISTRNLSRDPLIIGISAKLDRNGGPSRGNSSRTKRTVLDYSLCLMGKPCEASGEMTSCRGDAPSAQSRACRLTDFGSTMFYI